MAGQKELLTGKYEYFRMVLGMTRRMVEQWPADRIGFRPVPEVRSAAEILTHMYTFLVEGAVTVKAGRHEKQEEPTLGSKDEVLRFMDAQVAQFYALWAELGDTELERTIEAYGTEFVASDFLGFVYDEHWHHRGQLTVYLRMCGVEPLMIYDYGSLAG